MADNVTYTVNADSTPPNGTVAATDELADGSHAGIGKLAVSANGDRTLIPATAADGLLVNLGANNDVTVSGTVSVTEPVSVDDNGGSLTVDAPVATPVNVQVGDGALTATVRNTGAADSLNVAVVDAAGNQITSFSGSGVSHVDDDPFSPGVDSMVPVGGMFDDAAPDSVAEGDAGVVRMSANRNLYSTIRDAAGNERGVNVTAGNALTVDGSASTQPVSNAGLTALNGAIAGTEVQVDVVGAIPAGNNNIGDVDVASLPAIPAGNNNIGDVDVASIAAGDNNIGNVDIVSLPDEGQQTMANSISVAIASNQSAVPVSGTVSVTGVSTLAEQQTQTTALQIMDDWDESDRAKVNLIVGQAGVQGASGAVSANTQRVVLATDVALPAGTNNIGDVDILSLPNEGQQTMANSISVAVASDQSALTVAQATASNLNAQVVGAAANASPTSGNPVYIAGRASNAIPTDVGADGDAAGFWMNRNGAQMVSMAPHLGIMGSPWTLTSETAQYTTTQTSTVLVAGGASERLVVTKVQIQVGGTTAGTLQLYFGTGAYSRGTNLAIFDGEFAPSATLKPGVIMDGPFISATNGDDLLVTDSAAINPLTITVWYYVVT